MYDLLASALISLAIYPLNPVAEDTVNSVNAHFAVGYTAGNGVINDGLEASSRLELSLGHPIIVRPSVEFRKGSVTSRPWPKGDMYTTSVAFDALYYRGTIKLTAYLGVGIYYCFNHFNGDSDVMDSLNRYHGTSEVQYENNMGFRITAGMRMKARYTFELAFSRMNAAFVFDETISESSHSYTRQETSINDARISIGYIFPVRRR